MASTGILSNEEKDNKQNIAFVILAAGESKRMGSIKQLLQWHDKNLINHIIDKSIDSDASDTFIVLGANSEIILNTYKDKPVQSIYNNNWKKGLGSSISAAAEHIVKLQKAYSGILTSLVDQPLISTLHFNNLISKFTSEETGIVATSYKGSPGVPAIFSTTYFNDLIQLGSSSGAKSIIHAHTNDTGLIPFDDNYIDLDTPEDFVNFLNQQA